MNRLTDIEMSVSIDPENPWIGLFSYSEETRAYFHGRDDEAAELARRVQRKLLTVLFGQSGLGKTSLLRAGIVPRLRAEGYCPVYVRVDYSADAPPPSEQIKQAIFRATSGAGYWTRPGAAIDGESLWEFLHHRGDLLRDEHGETLLPLLIFDQFEEIFTLAQADDAGRLRARQFLEDLADLVENRPPAALEARLDNDDEAAAQFDFARADYRVLIALREDYLAHLESVKDIMPSITQNRMRLARMNGAQALSAVVKPGGRLVSQEVAESIVRFVAGGSELVNAEIEPSLLSLVCRELNTVRQAQDRREISADLLAGSRETILTEFYERTLADQPAGVRRVVEDELLTESGYRESLAEERVNKALTAAGASPDSLATLVNRRLLRIEERLDMRRVELTHDVLCSVVLASRNRRQEREARDETERQLAAQQEREAATRRALVRARTIATVCAVLMVIAAVSAIFGFVSLRRARVADAAAQESKTLAERARGDAEKLVAFLIEDFYDELAPTGRLDTLGKLAHMTVGYYSSLPPELLTPRTRTYRAMAMIREAAAQNANGDVDAAYKNFGEAQHDLEALRAAGDTSEAVTYGLALSLYEQGHSAITNGRGTKAQLDQAADLLAPLVKGPNPSREARLTYADILNVRSHTQSQEQAVATCKEALDVLAGMGALDLTDLSAASAYADTADSEARHLLSLDKKEEAAAVEQQGYDISDKILRRRPSDLRSLTNRYFAAQFLSQLADRRNESAQAYDYAQRSAQAGEDLVRADPSDLTSWYWWASGLMDVASHQQDSGDLDGAMATIKSGAALADDARLPSNVRGRIFFVWSDMALLDAELGDAAGAEREIKNYNVALAVQAGDYTEQDPRRKLFATGEQLLRAAVQLQSDPQASFVNASAALNRIDQIDIPATDKSSLRVRGIILEQVLTTAARSALLTGRYTQAETYARRLLTIPISQGSSLDPRIRQARMQSLLAFSLLKQDRREEARAAIDPGLAYLRQERAAGANRYTFCFELVWELYVSALETDGAVRSAQLAEAAKVLAAMPTGTHRMATYKRLVGFIATAQTP